jgi:hypothetical protein
MIQHVLVGAASDSNKKSDLVMYAVFFFYYHHHCYYLLLTNVMIKLGSWIEQRKNWLFPLIVGIIL